MSKIIPDFPSGPLDRYRNNASFDWKKLKIFLNTEEIIEYQDELYKELQKYPVLFPQGLQTPSLDEQKRIAATRALTLLQIPQISFRNTLTNLRKPVATLTTLTQLDPSSTLKYYVASGMFPSGIQSLGTEQHFNDLDAALNGDIIGAYCLTEIGHGSNAKFMQTIARYDKDTREFVLHTPNFEAAKCWAALLGQMATHAIVYAQLITSDGVNHHLHPFLVKLRDPKTLQPYPGITVGDMGEKIGLNGIDNGFLIFNNYRVPKTALLNKTGDVTEDGKYITPYKDPNKRYGASLGTLSIGRVIVTSICGTYISHALTIALRYAAVRKQFGPEGDDEIPILEYQTHQYRLLPYLSVAYLLNIFGTYLLTTQYKFIIDSMTGENKDVLADLGLELHAISSASKPVAGWVVRDGIQECREACAGHGYLKASGIGDIKNAHDANCTYEGENHVLIQQTSNWLLKFWPLILRGQKISSPLGSVNYLTNTLHILEAKLNVSSVEEFIKPNNIFALYRWLVCYLLKVSHEKYEVLTKDKKLDPFWAKNDSQVFYMKNLGIAYVQHFMMDRMWATISEATNPELKIVLTRLLSLYGIWSLEKHVATFYEGGYANGHLFTHLVQNSILKLCRDIKDDSVALVDVIAPPDILINSVLGRSDGMVYKHLEAAMVQAPGALSRPKWWKEIAQYKEKMKSKL